MLDYIKKHYGVEAFVGEKVFYDGESGIIFSDGGHYVVVNMNKDKPGVTINIHPTDDLLKFTGTRGKIRSMTASQRRYQEYLRSECGESFAWWIGCEKL